VQVSCVLRSRSGTVTCGEWPEGGLHVCAVYLCPQVAKGGQLLLGPQLLTAANAAAYRLESKHEAFSLTSLERWGTALHEGTLNSLTETASYDCALPRSMLRTQLHGMLSSLAPSMPCPPVPCALCPLVPRAACSLALFTQCLFLPCSSLGPLACMLCPPVPCVRSTTRWRARRCPLARILRRSSTASWPS